ENDIQAYQVITSRALESSHADNVDEALRLLLPGDTISQVVRTDALGSNLSQVNLQALGVNQTLILVDGARMPSLPSQVQYVGLAQPGLNGIPIMAIDRIESLTGTAGGIYGPGAMGGVVNVVLKRDYTGAEFAVTGGISDRGDAMRERLDGRIGF